jgi:Flp pilus assembly protein TadD
MQIRCGLPIILLTALTTAGCETGSRNHADVPVSSVGSYDAATTFTPDEALRTAETLRDSGAYREALQVLARAHRRYPDNAAIMSAYGRLALLGGDDDRAEDLLQKAVAANPDDWQALSALGVLESRRGRQASAREALGKANAISKGEAVTLNNLAVSHLLAGQPASAIMLLRQALRLPSLKSAYAQRIRRNLALALAVAGRFTEAEMLSGGHFPRNLEQAKPALIRRFLKMEDRQVSVPSLSQGASANLANGWRPFEEQYVP